MRFFLLFGVGDGILSMELRQKKAMLMKPNILIVPEEGYAREIAHWMVPCDYGTAVGEVGGLPLVALDAAAAEAYAAMADGLLLVGGNDIHCARYGAVYQKASDVPKLSRRRETLEFDLCRLFLQAKKPIFGIGRGMQVLNVALGGRLRSVTGHRATTENGFLLGCEHTLTVSPDRRLTALLRDGMTVDSWHHEVIDTLGDGLVAVAWAEETVEAIEHTALPVFGVQWHPERMSDNALFERFVTLCGEVER